MFINKLKMKSVRKYILYLIMGFLGLAGKVNGKSVDKATVYEGAVCWFTFDVDGSDSIGNNTLKPHNVTYTYDPVRGNVANIDKSDTGYFEFSKNPISGEQFSITSWIYLKSSDKDSWQTIFEFVNSANLSNFYFCPDNGNMVVSENKTKSTWLSVGAPNYQTPYDTWVHLALTFDGGNVVIYANGIAIGSGIIANTMSGLGCNRFFIGSDPLRLWRAIGAMYDDFAVFNQVLTQSQIYAIAHDTLAGPPTDPPYVFEAEDYAFDNWKIGTEGDTTYSYYSVTPDTFANADNSLLYGVINGQVQQFLWARVKTNVNIYHPFWTQTDNDAWKICDSISPTVNWKWVILQSLTPSSGSKHILKIAPANSDLRIDKFLVTDNWLYDPNKDYIKKDSIAPTSIESLSSESVNEYTATLTWHSSPVKDSISSYDILEGDKVITSTTDTFAFPILQSSTLYNFSVRAKDRAGNLSVMTNAINITTKDISFTADFSFTNQTIHHFGASDAWSVETIGLWPSEKRDSLAKLLFSKKFDSNGNPEGAGLSNWRFRIGDGSRDQKPLGLGSSNWYKTTHCFLDSATGTYNWNKQAGSLWFLNKAKEYGVEHFTAWTDSPPFFMTKNGYVFRTTTAMDTTGYNLSPNKYSAYASFLANVANHFESEGIHFDVISPVNEPQWSWGFAVGQGGQPGSFCSNFEISNLVKSINAAFIAENVKSKILISEAGSIDYLYGNTGVTANQVYNFYNHSSSMYLGGLESLSNYVSGHGYYTETTVQSTIASRQSLQSKLSLTNSNLEYWQTEYSLLSTGYSEKPVMEPIDYSLFIARVIHYDLTVGNCTGWDWWTAFSRPWAEDHKYRFALINWYPNIEDTTCNDGTFDVTKNLWVIGNYSHFVHPGYHRVSVIRSDALTQLQSSDKQLVSAYLSPKSDTVVYVVINYADFDQHIKLNYKHLSYSDSIVNFKTYVTSASDNLKAYPGFDMVHDSVTVAVKARSVSTFVGTIKKSVTIVNTAKLNMAVITVFPNPTSNTTTVEIINEKGNRVVLSELSGKQIAVYYLQNGKVNIDTKGLKPGYYLVSVYLNSGIKTRKLMVIR
jgi:O-glycosyl hydrolase